MSTPSDRLPGETTPPSNVDDITRNLTQLQLNDPNSPASPITARPTLAELQTNMSEITYEIDGVTITVIEEELERENETLYPKAKRKDYDAKDRNELLDLVQKHQQELFKSMSPNNSKARLWFESPLEKIFESVSAYA